MDYSFYPYGDYKNVDDRIFYPVSNRDERIPGKERVYGIIVNSEAKIYRFGTF
jgi:hypothetical protein